MAKASRDTIRIRLKPAVKKRLARLARSTGQTPNFLISDAVESYVADRERLGAETRQAGRQLRSGHYVRDEEMKAWLRSWGTDHELPPPKCICGKDHDDEELCR